MGSLLTGLCITVHCDNETAITAVNAGRAYHLSELTGPGELVLVGPNGKQRVNSRDFAREPCVRYAQ